MSLGAIYKRILPKCLTTRCKLFMKNGNVLDDNTYITNLVFPQSPQIHLLIKPHGRLSRKAAAFEAENGKFYCPLLFWFLEDNFLNIICACWALWDPRPTSPPKMFWPHLMPSLVPDALATLHRAFTHIMPSSCDQQRSPNANNTISEIHLFFLLEEVGQAPISTHPCAHAHARVRTHTHTYTLSLSYSLLLFSTKYLMGQFCLIWSYPIHSIGNKSMVAKQLLQSGVYCRDG